MEQYTGLLAQRHTPRNIKAISVLRKDCRDQNLTLDRTQGHSQIHSDWRNAWNVTHDILARVKYPRHTPSKKRFSSSVVNLP